MKYWNFTTPLSLLASFVWNFAEKRKISLPYPHIIFGLMIQSKPTRINELKGDK